jgi:hypothetical protein
MRLRCFLLFLLVAVSDCKHKDVDVKVSKKDGSFQVLLQKELWFNSGPFIVRNNSKTYSTVDGSLKFLRLESYNGGDALGSYTSYQTSWTTSEDAVNFITSASVYDEEPIVSFSVSFPGGLKDAATGNTHDITSSFPSFLVEELDLERAFLSYGGNFASDIRIDSWGEYIPVPGGIDGGVPLVIFNSYMNKTVVMSPGNSFMSASQTTIQTSPQAIGYGLLGTIADVPPLYMYKTLLVAGENVTGTMRKWGELLRKEYGKDDEFRKTDFSLNYLGYWTDHGSCYYYSTGQYKDYEQVYKDVYWSSSFAHIPIRYMQMDSWWYYKGINDGVKNWTAIEGLFPNGFDPIKELTGWPVVAHNRFWSSDTDYSMSNGGNFHFIEDSNNVALPSDRYFWSSLFDETKKTFDLAVYEQDWLYVQSSMPSILNDLFLGRTWLMEMGQAAVDAKLTIQYCMPWPRHLLQSLEIPAVTQARASQDYLPSTQQWRIGDTAMLTNALGLSAFKDTFQTNPDESKCKTVDKEKYPALETYIAALSGGPVGVGDAAFSFNATLLQATCMSDGRLLKPSRPAMSLDSSFVYRAFDRDGPTGPIYVAYTEIAQYTWYHIIAADLSEEYSMCAHELPPSSNTFPQSRVPFSVLFRHDLSGRIYFAVNFTYPQECFSVGPCGREDFQYWTVAPVMMNSVFAFLGEWNKIVTVSATRFTNIEHTGSQTAISLIGAPGERVEVAFFNIFAVYPTIVQCLIAQSGSAVVHFPEMTCVST